MNYKKASDILLMCSSYERFETFLSIKDKLDDKTYWRILSEAYIDSDNLFKFSKELKQSFSVNRNFKMFLMNKADQKFYNELPNKVTIYRGMTQLELDSGIFGISWSLSKKIAEFFAYTYGRNHDTKHLKKVVHELNVSKDLICAYFSERQEDEVIFLGF